MKQVAHEMNISIPYLSQVINSVRPPTKKLVSKISKALKLSLEEEIELRTAAMLERLKRSK